MVRKIIVTVSSVAYLISVMLIVTNIILRYFNYSLNFAHELSLYLFIFATFITSSVLFYEHRHISLNIFEKIKNKRVQRFFQSTSAIFSISYMIILLISSIYLIHETYIMEEVSIDMNIPYYILYLIVPVSAVVTVVFIIKSLFKRGN
ncbi:TRAP transporter small permease [Deferribacter abyssi]|uniref:TRAP transporter small permease n=1 Tax=Deferribacter abyssi TaxID=213806 RepID=UPI003C1A7952